MTTNTDTKITLRNTITGQYYSDGFWSSNRGEIIKKDSPHHLMIQRQWSMEYVEEVKLIRNMDSSTGWTEEGAR